MDPMEVAPGKCKGEGRSLTSGASKRFEPEPPLTTAGRAAAASAIVLRRGQAEFSHQPLDGAAGH